ncbi:MAG TPA: hypothetical protein VMF59_02835 [Bacteroidota bacterium]|nr:hypothetical protein [Bacteroidota bacterium]
MRLPGGGGEPGTRFNYRGMHRYLITLLAHPSCTSLGEKETVIPTLDVLRASCHAHFFEVYAYCFLPDRLVLLVRGKEESSDMKVFLTAFRKDSESAHGLRGGKHLWSKKYQERVLRKTEVTRAIADEVFRLPAKAGLAPGPDRYEYQGSFVLPGIPPPRPRGGIPPGRKGRPPFRRAGGKIRKTGRT